MPMLHVQLLGDFQMTIDGEPVTTVNQPRLQALIVYLLLNRHAPQSRQKLAFTLWPDAGDIQARNSLRQLVYQLRQALPHADRFLRANANTIQWVDDGTLRLDMAEFEASVARAAELERRADGHAARAALDEAVGCYTGDLLTGCYDDWLAPERERLRRRYRAALVHLIALLEDARAYGAALDYARQLLEHDPLNEAANLRLMRLHALDRDRAGALRVYHQCATLLDRELGVEPGAPLRAAYEQLLRLDTAPPTAPTGPALHAGATPLVGRHAEWDRLRTAWERALGGRASIALIVGEAGLGKTRLADELLDWAGRQGIAVARTRAYAAEGRLAYAPIADWLRGSALSIALGRLDGVWLREIARLLPELLATHPTLAPPGPLAEYWQRRHFQEALARGVLTGVRPRILQFDDLQWCDPETIEWLHFLLRFDPTASLLIVGTLRRDELDTNPALITFLQALRRTDQLTELPLAPLDAAETAELATHVGGRGMTMAESLRLFRETEGNPLFIVEMSRAQFGPDGGAGGWDTDPASAGPAQLGIPAPLPPKVHAVIAGRLARLSEQAAELVGVAAAIGRAFTIEVLARACGRDEDALVNALDELWQRRIIREQGLHAYDFSHDKLREVAYLELSPVRRRALHRQVARVLEAVHDADLDPVSAQLAAHWERAGRGAQALAHYERAATVAQRVFAHDDAIHLLHRGLALLHTLPPSRERDERELALQTALSRSLVAREGYGATEVMGVYDRVQNLCEQLGRPLAPPILRALVIASITHTAFRRAHAIAEQLLTAAEAQRDRVLIVEGRYACGVTSFYQGALEESRAHLEQALARYDLQDAATHVATYSQEPRSVCLIRLALDLWCLGYPEQAAALRAAALAAAQASRHPFSIGYCLAWDATLLSVCGDVEQARGQAEVLVAFGREHRLGQWLPMGIALRGWAIAEQGDLAAGLAELSEGIAAFRAAGSQHLGPYFSALLADLHAQLGDTEHALRLLAEGLEIAERSGERWYAAELYRRRGHVLLGTGATAAAERALRSGLTAARTQRARAFELRVATQLARLWQQRGEVSKAHRQLASIHRWFGERAQTPDVRAAGDLLEALAR